MAGIKTKRLHEFSTGEAGTPGLWLRGGLPPLQYNPLRNWGSLMGMKRLAIGFVVAMFVLAAHDAFGQQKKVKVIADQDSAGPQGTNFLSLLMLLRAPQIELLGITTVSGDQWVCPATVFALWATEQAGRTDCSSDQRGRATAGEYTAGRGTSRGALRVLCGVAWQF